MMETKAITILATLALTLAMLACGGSQTTPEVVVVTATPQVVVVTATPDLGMASNRGQSQPKPQAGNTKLPPLSGDSTREPAPAPQSSKHRLSAAQIVQVQAHIADLEELPRRVAQCAAENGETVPEPGSLGEVDWYVDMAIKYADCASS